MRSCFVLFLVPLALGVEVSAQTCTGLCLQQTTCPTGQTTSISGTVYAPNGTDPLPDVLVYIPNAPVDPFTAGVSCPVVGAPPSGSPLVGTSSAFDGTFTIANMPVGSNIPLVIESGRWRRQLVVPTVTACTNTPLPAAFATMPQNQSQGDIPKFAIATGSADQVECVLRKVGIDDSEFTDPSGSGRINLYSGSGSAGALVDASTLSEHTLMGTASTLNSYDVLMLPCEGSTYPADKTAQEYANLVSFADAGGRVYSSHFSYQWMYQNPPFNGVVNWLGTSATLPDGIATVDTSFSAGQTLAQWLQLPVIGASTTLGQIAINTNKYVFNGVIPPTQSWLTLNDPAENNPVMQFVFDTPIPPAGTTANQCGRVLFNEYHVENPPSSPAGKVFPTECSTAAMTPQEKLLEYSLFELTSEGAAATLTPATQDFGTQALGFNSSETFVWTNNSSFPSAVTLLTGSGDFNVTSSNCSAVASGAACQINVVFGPTALGARTGTLTVGSSGSTLTSSLTGKGIPDLVLSTTSLTFFSQDVGASTTQNLTVTNSAPGPVALPAFATTGDFSVSTTCPAVIPSLVNCTIGVTFKPTAAGPRSGTMAAPSNNPADLATPVVLSGNGIDFLIAVSPGSGQVVAGDPASTSVTVSPLAGFANPVSLSCTTLAVASTCTTASTSFDPAEAIATAVSITTTAKYAVIGYGGFGGSGFLWLVALASGMLLWTKRRSARALARSGLIVVLLAAASFGITGCSGKSPAQNPVYTAPGNYAITLTATDGFLVHSATYTLTVTAN
jgi:hypothetical protein